MSTELNNDVFEQWMGVLQRDIQGIHARLDVLNGRTRSNETDIAILKERSEVLKDTKKSWDGVIGGLLVAAILGAWKWLAAGR
jgi:hypothetical protein